MLETESDKKSWLLFLEKSFEKRRIAKYNVLERAGRNNIFEAGALAEPALKLYLGAKISP